MPNHSHSYDTVVVVARDMKPRARVHESRIPTLKHIVRIQQVGPKAVQRIPYFEDHSWKYRTDRLVHVFEASRNVAPDIIESFEQFVYTYTHAK